MTSSRKLKIPQAQLGDPMTAKSVIGEKNKKDCCQYYQRPGEDTRGTPKD